LHDTVLSSLRELGWNDTFAVAFAPQPETSIPARVSRSDRGGSLIVETTDGPERARLPASFRRLPPIELPTVGD
jgi:hypothetical protein